MYYSFYVISAALLLLGSFGIISWLILLVFSGAIILMSTYGYSLLLLTIRRWRKKPLFVALDDFPQIAVIIPTLNEVDFIEKKIENLFNSDYPRHLIRLIVVDGGSTDGTLDKLEYCMKNYPCLEIRRVPSAAARSDQINNVLLDIEEAYIVLTDVDGILVHDCISKLITHIVSDSSASLVGSKVSPVTPLLEEQIYWWFQNKLWALEGEALNSSMVSGVCYAFRSSLVKSLPPIMAADDIHLALRAMLSGAGGQICTDAKAYELRTPHNCKQMVQFRSRRGKGYINELTRFSRWILSGMPNSICAFMHLWHARVTPHVLILFSIAYLVCISTGLWIWPIVFLAALTLPYIALLYLFKKRTRHKYPLPNIFLAGFNLVAIALISISFLSSFWPKPIEPLRNDYAAQTVDPCATLLTSPGAKDSAI